MSPQAGHMLVNEIAPRLRTLIPQSVTPLGCEDAEELIQDSIALAAKMIHNVEAQGKMVTAGNIAYYAVLHMRSGRRSTGRSCADVMAPGTQLDQKSSLSSIEDEVAYDPEIDEPITLGDLLASDQEDPATAGARNVDWDSFIASHDYRFGVFLKGLAEGRSFKEAGRDCGMGRWSGYYLQKQVAKALVEYLGPDAIADSVHPPQWKANLECHRRH